VEFIVVTQVNDNVENLFFTYSNYCNEGLGSNKLLFRGGHYPIDGTMSLQMATTGVIGQNGMKSGILIDWNIFARGIHNMAFLSVQVHGETSSEACQKQDW
jgi:hypothetical protein